MRNIGGARGCILTIWGTISNLYQSLCISQRFQKIYGGLSEVSCKPVFFRPEPSRTTIFNNCAIHHMQVNSALFSDFFQANLVCLLSKNVSNRKNDNYQTSFLHANLRNRKFQKFRFICDLNHLPYLSKDFPDC